MSGSVKKSHKHFEEVASQSSSSMHFWGVCCESGKQYAQVVGQRFRITMAVLDPKSFQNDAREKIVSLIVLRGGIEYLLCILKHGEIHQVNLNLIFDKGENVKFYINGHGKVYLSGYQLTDSERDVTNDENGYLCPLVEVKSKSRKSSLKNVSMSPMDIEPVASSSSNKNKNKGKQETGQLCWSSYINQVKFDDDESDEDFSLGDEDTDEQDSSIDSAEEELADITKEELSALDNEALEIKRNRNLEESDESEEESDESEEDSEEEEEIEVKQISGDSRENQKRKNQKKVLPQKRSRNDSHNSSTEHFDEVICLDESECNDKSVSFNVKSAGSTPLHKKQLKSDTPFSEIKAKKEKKLREMLKNVGGLDKEELAAIDTSTPKQNKYPVEKLDGGVEIQEVVVGRGPGAVNGKMLHVFFVGRLPDNSIFDSRTPGKKPFSFRLGAKEVIKGWEVGLQGMRVGGKRKIKVPPAMAYGNRSEHGIPPNTPLRFIVTLQGVS